MAINGLEERGVGTIVPEGLKRRYNNKHYTHMSIRFSTAGN